MNKFRNLSIFDLDRTLIQGNVSALFFRYLQRHACFSLHSLISFWECSFRYRYMNLDISNLHHCIFYRHLYCRHKALFVDYVPRFLQKLLPGSLYVPSVLKLRLAQQLGHYTLILSNSPDFLVEPIAKYLRVHGWRATEYLVDGEGRFDKLGVICHGPTKAEALRTLSHTLNISRQNTHAYSDSIHDIELLRIAGHPVVVNPDAELKKISEKEGWQTV